MMLDYFQNVVTGVEAKLAAGGLETVARKRLTLALSRLGVHLYDGQHRVARGGSFLTSPAIARTTFRNFYLPHIRAAVLGLRLAR